MKKLILLPLLLVAFISMGQKQTADSDPQFPNPFQFTVVDSTATGTKTELFVKSNEWVAKAFSSAKDVIQMSDKDAGKIIAKGIMTATSKFGLGRSTFYIKYTLSIDVKDSKCRVKLYDFAIEQYQVISSMGNHDINDFHASLDSEDPPHLTSLSSFPQKTWHNIKEICTSESNGIINNLTTSLKAKSDNW